MKLRLHIYLLLLLAPFLACCDLAYADSPTVAIDYTQVADDGKFVLVMLVPGSSEELAHLTAGLKPEIRAKYAHSGLYPNDGSTSPVWTVDWFDYDVIISDNGHYAAR